MKKKTDSQSRFLQITKEMESIAKQFELKKWGRKYIKSEKYFSLNWKFKHENCGLKRTEIPLTGTHLQHTQDCFGFLTETPWVAFLAVAPVESVY